MPHLTGNRRRRLGTVGRECAAREQHGTGQCEQKSFHRVHHTAKRRSAIMSQNETRKPANAQWGGRFTTGPAEVMERINVSLDFAQRLYAQDTAGSQIRREACWDKAGHYVWI